MDVRQFRYFVAIAEEGSLSAAANRLNVAQPALSQHVITLEKRLDVKLLERSPRGVTLTQPGEVLLAHARGILAALDVAVEAVRQSGAEPQGEVAFGLPSSIAMVLSVPLAETVRLELPKVRLRVVDAMSGFIQGWLDDQSIDLGMLYDVGPVRHLSYRLLMSEELCVFSAPDAWPFAAPPGTPVPLAEVAKVELVLPSRQHGLRSMIDRIARAHGHALVVTTEMDGLAQIKSLVARGSGATILAPAAALDYVERGELVMASIAGPRLVRPVYLVRNPGKPLTRASQELERITLEVVRDLTARGIWQAASEEAPGDSPG
jgi:LysR family transcriptional regulator, nitrogen assimilation regulatory protein